MGEVLRRFHEYDIWLLRWVHQNRVEHLDDFLTMLSYATTFVSITVMLAVLLYSFKIKSKSLKFKFFRLLFSIVTAALLTSVLKILISRQRPFIQYADVEKLSEAGSHSFPSGHTTEVFALAVAIMFLFKSKILITIAFGWAVVVAYSRITLGVHYPSDVLGGVVLGWLVSLLTIRFSIPKNAQLR